jgi:hypothetical protein
MTSAIILPKTTEWWVVNVHAWDIRLRVVRFGVLGCRVQSQEIEMQAASVMYWPQQG